jgi:hypothetical protein
VNSCITHTHTHTHGRLVLRFPCAMRPCGTASLARERCRPPDFRGRTCVCACRHGPGAGWCCGRAGAPQQRRRTQQMQHQPAAATADDAAPAAQPPHPPPQINGGAAASSAPAAAARHQRRTYAALLRAVLALLALPPQLAAHHARVTALGAVSLLHAASGRSHMHVRWQPLMELLAALSAVLPAVWALLAAAASEAMRHVASSPGTEFPSLDDMLCARTHECSLPSPSLS